MIVIGLTGKARSGKDTAAAHLIAKHGFVKVAFADPIREMAACLIPEAYTPEAEVRKEENIPWLGKSRRRVEQLMGTEFGRDMVHKDLWVMVAHNRIQKIIQEKGPDARIVITDVRFINEAEFLTEIHGATVIAILRPSVAPVATHRSEAGLPHDLIDHSILNDSSLTALHYQLDREVCRHILD